MSQTVSCHGLSVFFPAYNDAGSIGKLVGDAISILPRLTDDYEVIVINDGSTDDTGEVLNGLVKKHERLRVITHATNRGYGAALKTGFNTASKDLVFYTDGDGQYDVSELPLLFEKLDEGTDIVNGYKRRRSDAKRRKVLGAVYNRFIHFLFDLPIRDVDCDFRLIRKRALDDLDLTSDSGGICVELICKLKNKGCIFAEVSINHYERLYGHSQFFTPGRVVRTLFDSCSLWFTLVVFSSRAKTS